MLPLRVSYGPRRNIYHIDSIKVTNPPVNQKSSSCTNVELIRIDRTNFPEYTIPYVVERRAQHQELVRHACGVGIRIACSTNARSMQPRMARPGAKSRHL